MSMGGTQQRVRFVMIISPHSFHLTPSFKDLREEVIRRQTDVLAPHRPQPPPHSPAVPSAEVPGGPRDPPLGLAACTEFPPAAALASGGVRERQRRLLVARGILSRRLEEEEAALQQQCLSQQQFW